MMLILKRLSLALSYVTACPFLQKPSSEQEIAGLSKYLPVVGLVVGAVLATLSFVLHLAAAPPAVIGALIVTIWIAFTGGIHLDGLMDAADGIFSHRSRERMLEIMRDSRTGNFGAVCGFLLMLCKFAGVVSADQTICWAALLVVPAWARWCEVITIGCYPYAREEGMGKIWHSSTSVPRDIVISALLPVLVTAVICYFTGAWQQIGLACSATVTCGLIAAMYINAQINGQTGDTYGAVVEISEAAGVIALAIAYGLMAPPVAATWW